jgi:methionyl aminopeptidase
MLMPSFSSPVTIKTRDEIKTMQKGGKKLAKVKDELKTLVKNGTKATEIEELATKLIVKEGGKPSFKMVPGYYWTTCVNINSGLVHGIPKDTIIFKRNDLVSVDLGMFYKGFHTDTSFSKVVEGEDELKSFLKIGERALKNAIKKAIPGMRIYDISKEIEDTLKLKKLNPIKSLVGHGIGRNLHEEPEIPCFIHGRREETLKILPGMTFAIEVMYSKGSGEIEITEDGWTIRTRDGKISALFEETIAVTEEGTMILTA